MISPLNDSARNKPNSDLPLAVGPTIAMMGYIRGLRIAQMIGVIWANRSSSTQYLCNIFSKSGHRLRRPEPSNTRQPDTYRLHGPIRGRKTSYRVLHLARSVRYRKKKGCHGGLEVFSSATLERCYVRSIRRFQC